MNSETVKRACEKHKDLVDLYFKNDGKVLYSLIDKVLFKLKFDVEKSDFYSLGSEIFLDALCRYDGRQSFDKFLYFQLYNKFKTEMTRRNRQKRQADKMAISWETPLDNESGLTVGDKIKDTKKAEHYDIDKTFFEDDGEKYSEKMLLYISKLSKLQREVVKLIIAGYTKDEIKMILHISSKECEDCYDAIRSYRNIEVLM